MGFVNDDQECGLHRIVFTIENKFERCIRIMQTMENQIKVQTISFQLQ